MNESNIISEAKFLIKGFDPTGFYDEKDWVEMLSPYKLKMVE